MALADRIRAAARTATPLVLITTGDQHGTLATIREAINGGRPLVGWDAVAGLVGLNDRGRVVVAGIGEDELAGSRNPAAALELAASLPHSTAADDEPPNGAVLIMAGLHRFLADPQVAAGFWRLRDRYKSTARMLVGLGPAWDVPAELRGDVVILTETPPDEAELAEIARRLHADSGVPVPADLGPAVAAVRGLERFAAEQVLAMALRRDGLDLSGAWEDKRARIAQVPGLALERNGPTFADLRGNAALVDYLRALFSGPARPAGVLRLDEMEKMFAGLGHGGSGDSSGVTQEGLGELLQWQDAGSGKRNMRPGLILAGPPGVAKSLICQALAGEFGVPGLSFSLTRTKAGLVGQSGQNLRAALGTADATFGPGGCLIVATVNSTDVLPWELRRRFTLGLWYVDLPTREELAAIWELHLGAYGLPLDAPRPDDTDWTGAEVRNCADLAWRTGQTPAEAGRYIVPVARSNRRALDKLRDEANGTYLSSSYPGPYFRDRAAVVGGPASRRVTVGD
jgi:hypothetical protein